jgi:hypothetical protein
MNQIKILPGILLFFVFWGLSSCLPDEEADTPFQDSRDVYVGSWDVIESGPAKGYNVSIEKDPGNSSQILLYNFHNLLSQNYVYAIVTGDKFTIPRQEVGQLQIFIEGTAEYFSKDEMIEVEYSADDGAQLDNYSAAFYKN